MAGVRFFILTAVVPEARALARAFELAEVKASLPFWMRDELALAVVGVGARRLGEARELAAQHSPQVIVMAGVAGGLSPALQVGDVVVYVPASQPGLPPPPAFGAAFFGPLHTAQRLAATPRDKARLFAATGALAVDMETDRVAELAAKRGTAFVAVRGISDAADQFVDPQLLTLIDASGRPRIRQAMAMACRHPSKLRAMLRLGRSTKCAMESVAQTLRLLIASGWPGSPKERRDIS